jgi:hypothetical protein
MQYFEDICQHFHFAFWIAASSSREWATIKTADSSNNAFIVVFKKFLLVWLSTLNFYKNFF